MFLYNAEAVQVVRQAATPVAQLEDGRVAHIGCHRQGRLKERCTVKVAGPQNMRWHFTVRETASDYVVSARLVSVD